MSPSRDALNTHMTPVDRRLRITERQMVAFLARFSEGAAAP